MSGRVTLKRRQRMCQKKKMRKSAMQRKCQKKKAEKSATQNAATCQRLPRLYDPGPEVTVDEQLVAFRRRCPFRQYMPSKPAKYGIKSWVAYDAKSSYAWKMQVYTGKLSDGAPERNQGRRVVLDMTEGLKEVPSELLATNRRRVLSSQFAFTPTTTLVSYLAKKNKNVLLMSTRHTDAEISNRDDGKPTIILDYNRHKGGVDNLDKVVTYYSWRGRLPAGPSSSSTI
ncbi:piggyBac transposable element-derived protein 4-like [Osmerus mordax]|uniref:piggyBac transposable element-derived protein 4-like n=1 Tax=Osmerus mordax TaxID=8014 RepID=UPI00350EF7B8